jgi:hypothetical protein
VRIPARFGFMFIYPHNLISHFTITVLLTLLFDIDTSLEILRF